MQSPSESETPVIDLRSDTVTRPTPAMYQAMVSAPVGDDMAGEDPTATALETRIAEVFGHEAALFCCSGTMSNQIGIRLHCRPGDELLIHQTGHIATLEAGAPAALSGITCRMLPGELGLLDVPTLEAAWRTATVNQPETTLVCVENSTNMGGGTAWPLDQLRDVSRWTRGRGLKLHMDGARVFNAIAAAGCEPQQIGELCDTISICFSKGLGCPMGSALVGSAAEIRRARRTRKIFGGAMRQAGVVAAAALYAIEHHVDRLQIDHANARLFASQIEHLPGITVDLEAVQTNIVFFMLDAKFGTAADLAARLRSTGVLVYAVGPQRLRVVTHLDVNRQQVLFAADRLSALLTGRGVQSDPAAVPEMVGPQYG